MNFVGPNRWRDPPLGRPHHRRPVPVAHGPAHDERRIPVGRVVAVEGVVPALGCAVGLQVRRGRGDGIDRIADVGVGDVGELRGMGEGRGQELHRALGTRRSSARSRCGCARGWSRPARPPPAPPSRARSGRPHPGRGRGTRAGCRQRRPAAPDDPDACTAQIPASAPAPPTATARTRAAIEPEAAAAEPAAPRTAHRAAAAVRSASAASRSAGRVVSIAYSRRETTASKATWLRPTNSSPSPGRAWTSERRSAGVRSK